MTAMCRGRRSQSTAASKRSSELPFGTTSAKSASTVSVYFRLIRFQTKSHSFLLQPHALSIVLHPQQRQAARRCGGAGKTAVPIPDGPADGDRINLAAAGGE